MARMTDRKLVAYIQESDSLIQMHFIMIEKMVYTIYINFNTVHVFCYKCPKSYISIIVKVELLFYFKNMYKCHKSYA